MEELDVDLVEKARVRLPNSKAARSHALQNRRLLSTVLELDMLPSCPGFFSPAASWSALLVQSADLG